MQNFDPLVLEIVAEFICGDDDSRFPIYRSSQYLTRFFQNIGINVSHDGSTRKWWVLSVLQNLNKNSLAELEKVVLRLVDLKEYRGDADKLKQAVHSMNDILLMEGLSIVFRKNSPCIAEAKEINIDGIENEEYFPRKDTSTLQKEIHELNLRNLGIETNLLKILEERMDEIEFCAKNAPLSCIFLVGSSMEGILLHLAFQKQQLFNRSKSAPKKDEKVRKFNDWKLSEFIEVSYDIGAIGLDVKKHIHSVRDFRNFIHPYQQMSNKFSPNEDTIKIALQVFIVFIKDIQKFISLNNS